MIADVDWANLHVATAFVLGAFLGSLATIRVMRWVLGEYARSSRRRNADQGSTFSDDQPG